MTSSNDNKQSDKTRPSGGRPPLPRDQVRGQRIVTFMTAEEYSALLDMGQEQGLSMSALCHQILAEFIAGRRKS